MKSLAYRYPQNQILPLVPSMKLFLMVFQAADSYRPPLSLERLKPCFDNMLNTRLLIGVNGVIRNGYLPERTIQTGIGYLEIKVPNVREMISAVTEYTSTAHW
ncbi:MAG: hypothetical protein ACTS73_00330 [Arsenophonus sp. NEOnobi-MAG3]